MSNINEKSNFECKIFWNKDCLLPDDALNLAINIPSTTYEESLPLTTTDATEVFSPPEGLEFETDCDTAKITRYKGTATNVIIPSTIKHYDKTYIVTSIGENAFEDCENLTSVSIPNGVKNIGEHAFTFCRNLTSISIPNSVTSIGKSAFSYCSSLKSVTMGNSVTSIDLAAFSYCSSLTSITIGNSVTSIGKSAFSYCSSLKSVTFENTSGWLVTNSFNFKSKSVSSVKLANTSTAAKYLTSTYCHYYWERAGTTSFDPLDILLDALSN